ncbi:GNAT family N-acetyltransferase [Pseudomonas tohonis]|uniref:GNAT family N-acetyltransferase n=1 Tax=Pseudomonas tohonis TaxID=2725477 RepID=UPI0022F106AC|nr:GNAT family N-acetyltransferase [Pseudomonas tohonis]
MAATLRLATAADIESLFDIRTSVVQNHLSREQMAELGITPAVLADAIVAAPCCWIAEVDGTPAGFAMVDLEEGELFALFIRPGSEGLGLGRMLLQAAEEELFRNHERIWLITDGHEAIRANGFYRRHGWTLAGVVDERDVRYEKRRSQ